MRNLMQEMFDLSQVAGTTTVNDKFRWYLQEMEVDPYMVQQEARIEFVKDEIDELREEFDNLDNQIRELFNNGTPDNLLDNDRERLGFLARKLKGKEKWVEDMEKSLDEWALEKAEPEVEVEIEETPHHWVQAKEYYDDLLDTIRRCPMMSQDRMVEIYKQVDKAMPSLLPPNRKKKGVRQIASISSWHYCQILGLLAKRLGKIGEVKRIQAFEEKQKAKYQEKGWTWGPDHSKNEVLAEMAKVPGEQLYQEELESQYLRFNEMDLITAIDARR